MRMRVVPPVLFVSLFAVAWSGGCSGPSNSSHVGEPERADEERQEQEAAAVNRPEMNRPEMTERERETERLKREYGYAQWPKRKDVKFYPFAKGFRDTVGEIGKAFECEVRFTQTSTPPRRSASATLGRLCTIDLEVMEDQDAAKEYLIQYLTGNRSTLPWELRNGTPPTFDVGDVMVDEGDMLSFIRHNVAVFIRLHLYREYKPLLSHEEVLGIARKIDEMISREAGPTRKPHH